MRPDWHEDAACAEEGGYLFYAPDGERSAAEKAARERAAKTYCARCPVLERCRRESVNERYGVWGGLTEEERRR